MARTSMQAALMHLARVDVGPHRAGRDAAVGGHLDLVIGGAQPDC
jgi:hypothetical protein